MKALETQNGVTKSSTKTKGTHSDAHGPLLTVPNPSDVNIVSRTHTQLRIARTKRNAFPVRRSPQPPTNLELIYVIINRKGFKILWLCLVIVFVYMYGASLDTSKRPLFTQGFLFTHLMGFSLHRGFSRSPS